ncbi:uncharacterized protein LOC107273277 [Cephus cinctus]|uniref:Cytidine deaminase n=1 Tax=Cephus cinctus TaxID=211228 RepID=A0AAJ7CBM9_CEPCN|nr:uncharacterized protein LOC107273277 [Cephus cinctus]
MSSGTIVSSEHLDEDIRELVREATIVRERAYAPYSNFKVGAALRGENGTIFKGCNVENSAYPAGVCAERAALFQAVTEGQKKFKAVVVVASGNFTSPCGICRQALAEFGDMLVYLVPANNPQQILKTSIKELLPMAFSFNTI